MPRGHVPAAYGHTVLEDRPDFHAVETVTGRADVPACDLTKDEEQ